MIASDHGIKPMKGALVINRWLEENGYLKLKEKRQNEAKTWINLLLTGIQQLHRLEEDIISDHSSTSKIRSLVEQLGKKSYENILKQLGEDLERVGGPNGERWNNKTYMPLELHSELSRDPPTPRYYRVCIRLKEGLRIGFRVRLLEIVSENLWNSEFLSKSRNLMRS